MKNGLKIFFCCTLAVVLQFNYLFAQENSMIPNDALSVIHRRTSVREYTDKPVTKEMMEILIDAGMAAPTAADKRPWEFVAITKRETLDKLADGLEFGKMLKQATAAIVVCGIPENSLPGIGQMFWVQDCSAATENILLAAEAKNLGAVWIAVYPYDDRVDFVRTVMRIPSDVVPLNVISIGYPVEPKRPKHKIDPLKIHWELW